MGDPFHYWLRVGQEYEWLRMVVKLHRFWKMLIEPVYILHLVCFSAIMLPNILTTSDLYDFMLILSVKKLPAFNSWTKKTDECIQIICALRWWTKAPFWFVIDLKSIHSIIIDQIVKRTPAPLNTHSCPTGGAIVRSRNLFTHLKI